MGKKIISANKREKIKAALAKKPTKNTGLMSKELVNLRGKVIKRINKKSGTRKLSSKPLEVIKPSIFVEPKHKLLSLDWFSFKGNPKVSVIVPMHNSASEIVDQIKSWDLDEDILTEIIYVDDNCPQHSHAKVITTWNNRKNELKNGVGKIVLNQTNGGFGFSCNTGAEYASGEILIFLNADTTVTKNWIKPIVDLFEDSTIGIVGNLQTKNGKIDSAGSEWSWRSKSFEHIGRNTYQGQPLNGAIDLNNMPQDLKVPGEREMVTGCCLAIPRKLFFDIQGFDLIYRIGYWEDSDLNMKVRSRGLKVFFTPYSKIYHKVGHSKMGGNKLISNNRKIFEERWIFTGRLDPLIKNKLNSKVPTLKDRPFKIKAYVNNPNDEYLPICKESLSDFVDEWTTPNYLKAGDWFLWLDGCEVFREEHLWYLLELMKNYDVIIPQYWMFWNNFQTIGTGRWNKYAERFAKWKEGYSLKNGKIIDKLGNGITAIYPTWKGKIKLGYNCNWVRSIDKIEEQLKQYQTNNYLEDVFLKWRTNPEEVIETHPLKDGGWQYFPGILPNSIKS